MTFATEFPDFDPATLPAIPEGFADSSWGNDACPSFTNEAAGLRIWVDFVDPSQRELPESKRFGIMGTNSEVDLITSDDWRDIETAVEILHLQEEDSTASRRCPDLAAMLSGAWSALEAGALDDATRAKISDLFEGMGDPDPSEVYCL